MPSLRIAGVLAHLAVILVANRKTCAWCRHGVQPAFQFYSHHTLCPEHKRLRNRKQREASRG